ncbi:MAG: tyrosine-type recombinase/integrase [Microgenomates group bacterium]
MNQGYNLYNFEASFKKFLLAGNVKPVTVKNYLSDLRHFMGWLIFKLKTKNQKLKIDEDPVEFLAFITPELIENYKNYLIENKIPLKTTNRRLSTLRKFFSFCINQGWLKENPAKKISNVRLFDWPIFKKNQLSANQEKITNPNAKKILNQFHQDLLKENLDEKTIKNYLNDVKEFLSV